jgi:hypothetical protein
MKGDLGLNEWLIDRLLPVLAENIPATKTSIQRHVFFTIVTSGNITPTWKLVRISTTSSPLAKTGRTRTYDLIVTFGPQKPGATSRESLSVASYKVFVPSQTTLDLHNSALFGSSVAARLTPVLPIFTGLPFIGF